MAFYIFDVDGVLTDEHARPNKDVINIIEKLNKQSEQLALITGRSRKWLEDNIFSMLETSQDWTSLYCVAEHGAIKGRGLDIQKWDLDQDFILTNEVKDKLLKISEKAKYEGLIEWDETKESMGTVESVHGSPGDKEHLEQTRQALQDYAKEAEKIAKDYDKKVVISTYGVDVVPPDLSKRIGTEWVFKQNSPEKSSIYVFGDSKGDLVMAETAKNFDAKDVTFFWVGDGAIPKSESVDIKSKKSSAKYAAGTIELLNHLV